MNDVSHKHFFPSMASPSCYHYRQPQWPSQAHQPLPLFAGALAPSAWTNAPGPSRPQALWPSGPPNFWLPFHHHYPPNEFDSASFAARSDTSSVISRQSDLSPSPVPQVTQVVCNAPLVAPIPLPYHSPTFLLYDLPDEDEDLSHPPYTHRPHKRKRSRDEDEAEDTDKSALQSLNALSGAPPVKRRFVGEDSSDHWESSYGQWANSVVPSAASRHKHHPATFPRRIRAR